MIATERKPSTAPIFIVACPVHRIKVGLDGEGRLLGRCDGCAADAASAQLAIEKGRL